NKLAKDPSTQIYAESFKKEYTGANDLECSSAVILMYEGQILYGEYQIVSLKFNQKNEAKDIIYKMELYKNALLMHLSSYSKHWSNAIRSHIVIDTYPNFSQMLRIMNREYTRVGVFKEMELVNENIKLCMSKLDQNKHKNTFEAYAVLSQLADLAKAPQGSLISFNSSVNSLSSEFTKRISLAQFEL
ncbi:MAG: hypothetical protein GX660_19595, partial [Clostridiaceae bacterium]|nr:hypothetical protein [Clostridiaceae bacterium]